MKKRGVLMVLVAALGMMTFGCSQKASRVENREKAAETSDAIQAEEQKDDEALETSAPAQTEGTPEYEKYFDKKLPIDGQKKRFQILRNKNLANDVRMMVGKTEVALERVSVDVGYAQVRVKICDCTGDGRDDIVLILFGGAAGAYHEIQVLTRENGEWREVPFPANLWEENFLSIKKEGKYRKISVMDTKESKMVADASDEQWGTGYRTCKAGKDGRVSILYQIYRGDDVNNIAGKVKLTMSYDSETKAFKIKKIRFLF